MIVEEEEDMDEDEVRRRIISFTVSRLPFLSRLQITLNLTSIQVMEMTMMRMTMELMEEIDLLSVLHLSVHF